ncbi:head-tail connector protein [Roseovarius aestuarii]|nr:head-tail connector protein [Roseovarius aestuarii]
MNIITVTGPAEEPVSTAMADMQCKVETDDEAALLGIYISAARLKVEAFTRRRFVTQTVDVRLDGFSAGLTLPIAPVQAVTAVKYLDGDSVLQTVDAADYRLIQSGVLTCVVPVTGASWPVALCEPDAVRVTCIVGYGDAEDVPANFVVAMLLLTGHYYANRDASLIGVQGGELPLGVKDLLNPHVVWV